MKQSFCSLAFAAMVLLVAPVLGFSKETNTILIKYDGKIGIKYPTMAAIPIEKGLLQPSAINYWHLLQNGRPIANHKAIVEKWSDGSVKWLHIYAIFSGGKSYNLAKRLVRDSATPRGSFPAIPTWKVVVEDTQEKWSVSSSDIEFSIDANQINAWGLDNIHPNGSWVVNGGSNTWFEEISSSLVRVTRYEGTINSSTNNTPYLRFCLRITRYKGSDLIKFSHSVILAGNMKGKKIKNITFEINANSQDIKRPFIYNIGKNIDNAGETELNINKVTIPYPHSISSEVHQKDFETVDEYRNENKFTKHSNLGLRGYFSQGGRNCFIRDFWQKYPQSFKVTHDKLIYNQWVSKKNVVNNIDTDESIVTDSSNIHRLLPWHLGQYLECIPSEDWIFKFSTQNLKDGNNSEHEGIESIKNADMQGITFHDDIAYLKSNTSADLRNYNEVWQDNPVGYVDPCYFEQTNILDIAAKGNDFKTVESFLESSMLANLNPDRFKDFGRLLFGESHRVIKVDENRPSVHRMNLALYYSAGELYWRMRLHGAGKEVLKCSRRATEHYRSIVQNSYNDLQSDQTLWHNKVGGFWYRGLWWGNDPTLDVFNNTFTDHNDWNNLNGRAPDPDALYWSWILDGNFYHKDGYDLWFVNAIKEESLLNPSAIPDRENTKALVYYINAYKYYNNIISSNDSQQLFENIKTIGETMLNTSLNNLPDGKVGPLWHPEWCKKWISFIEEYELDESKKKFLISKGVKFVLNDIFSNNPQSQNPQLIFGDTYAIDLINILLDLKGGLYGNFFEENIDCRIYESRVMALEANVFEGLIMQSVVKSYTSSLASNSNWNNFGVGIGQFGDAWLKLQWPAYLKRLRAAGINYFEPYSASGFYPVSHGLNATNLGAIFIDRHPCQLLILKENSSEKINLKFNIMPKFMGDLNANLLILSPSRFKYGNRNNLDPFNIHPLNDISTFGFAYHLYYYVSSNSIEPLTLSNMSSNTHVQNFRGMPYIMEQEQNCYADSFMIPSFDTDTGLYRIFTTGDFTFLPEMTTSNPEALLLAPVPNPSDPNAGNWKKSYKDSKFYYKNLEPTAVNMEFECTTGIMKVEEYDMNGNFLNSSSLLKGEKAIFRLDKNEIKIIKTIDVYSGILKLEHHGRLLCGTQISSINKIGTKLVGR